MSKFCEFLDMYLLYVHDVDMREIVLSISFIIVGKVVVEGRGIKIFRCIELE